VEAFGSRYIVGIVMARSYDLGGLKSDTNA
jgi:hypothetical protein